MPSFDITSEVDMVALRNAVEGANRKITGRYDFKGSDARVEQADKGLVILFNVGSGMNERVLGQARGGVRYFQSFDGAASVLQSMGIMEFIARSANWVPRTAKSVSAQE